MVNLDYDSSKNENSSKRTEFFFIIELEYTSVFNVVPSLLLKKRETFK